MAKSKLKLKAFILRKQGKSIREIMSATGVPLSTASHWCRHIFLSPKQKALLIANQKSRSYAGRLKSTEHAKRERIAKTQQLKNEGIKEIGKLTDKELFCAGIGLYWGEGYRSQETIGFTSKDEQIVKFIMAWFRKFLRTKSTDFILRVSLNISHKKRINAVEKYWSTITKIPLKQFTKPSFVKVRHKKVYPSDDGYQGTLRIVVRKSCSMHRKFMGWIEGLYLNRNG